MTTDKTKVQLLSVLLHLFRVAFFSLFFLWQGLSTAAPQSVEENACVTCHSDIWEREVQGSVHARANILCQDCHGGDPTQLDIEAAKAPATGFVGVPDKKKIAETCGSCHANVEVMNFYGIRTDQLARYKTSGHGKKLFEEGKDQVAVCSDCHGHHHILPISDPNSSVYPTNIPKTCNQCHGNEALMAGFGLPADIFSKYQRSVHGKAVLEKKDVSAANCTSCHGSHGAIPPGVRDIGAACGKCHVNEKKYFLESVHAPVAEGGNFSECIACHGNHEVHPASKLLYRTACIQCHAAGSPAAEVGENLFRVLAQSESELKAAEALVKGASIEGIFVEEEMGALEDAKTNVISMAPVQHSLSADRISGLYEKFSEVAREIKTRVHQKREFLKWRKIALIPIWIFVLLMASALWYKYKQLQSRRKGNPSSE
ncbi:MAG: hypothetical protein A3A73_05915 [Omnitrophica bacterium RIFCSPLOWO2_01_FULL_50_24]|nr:MAG: hypothetical protein A3A73_05915 [Omnitrophica bacterium RIFCSPLOWO2_01_FULL_50_24]